MWVVYHVLFDQFAHLNFTNVYLHTVPLQVMSQSDVGVCLS